MRRSLAAASIALVAAVTGCGGGGGDDPASLVPEKSAAYAEVTLDPEGGQERALRKILGRFPGGDKADEAIERSIARSLREENVD